MIIEYIWNYINCKKAEKKPTMKINFLKFWSLLKNYSYFYDYNLKSGILTEICFIC